VNDANPYAYETVGDPAYPFNLLCRLITVSLESMRIVRASPPWIFWTLLGDRPAPCFQISGFRSRACALVAGNYRFSARPPSYWSRG
jgi:hypothetical protein